MPQIKKFILYCLIKPWYLLPRKQKYFFKKKYLQVNKKPTLQSVREYLLCALPNLL